MKPSKVENTSDNTRRVLRFHLPDFDSCIAERKQVDNMRYRVRLFGLTNKTFVLSVSPTMIDAICDGLIGGVYFDYEYSEVREVA